MKFIFNIAIILLLNVWNTQAQYPPQAYQSGSDAIPANDSRIQFWANACTFQKSWINIADTSLGRVSNGNASSAIGAPNLETLSLGDGGWAILEFPQPIVNGPGPDFAIFENGFLHPTDSTLAFLELAFVEVSSDGQNFFRFPATSLIQDSIQNDSKWIDATQVNNLAGKYIQGFGTPFDLEELKDEIGLDVNHITHIRVIDVVGSINELIGSYDANGRIINDPYPTPFPSGGFDLNAVGVLNAASTQIHPFEKSSSLLLYPNPVQDELSISGTSNSPYSMKILNVLGQKLMEVHFEKQLKLSLKSLPSGIYFLHWQNGQTFGKETIIKN